MLIHYRQKYGMNWEITLEKLVFDWHFNFLKKAWRQPQRSIFYFNATLTWSSADHGICNLQCAKLKIQNRIYRNVWSLILGLHCPQLPGYPSLHCESMYICVYSIFRCTYHTKFAIGRRIKKLNTETKWHKSVTQVAVLSFGIRTTNCYIFMNNVYIQLRTGFI